MVYAFDILSLRLGPASMSSLSVSMLPNMSLVLFAVLAYSFDFLLQTDGVAGRQSCSFVSFALHAVLKSLCCSIPSFVCRAN